MTPNHYLDKIDTQRNWWDLGVNPITGFKEANTTHTVGKVGEWGSNLKEA